MRDANGLREARPAACEHASSRPCPFRHVAKAIEIDPHGTRSAVRTETLNVGALPGSLSHGFDSRIHVPHVLGALPSECGDGAGPRRIEGGSVTTTVSSWGKNRRNNTHVLEKFILGELEVGGLKNGNTAYPTQTCSFLEQQKAP